MSTSARVSSNRSMGAFWNGTEREGKNRRKTRGCHSSIALHPHNFTTDDSGQVLGLAPNRVRHSAAAATSADQQHLPLSRGHPKLIGKARPATNGIRTSTKYQTKITNQPWKVNLYSHPKNALDAF